MIEGKTVIIGDDVQAGLYIDDSSNFNSVVTGEPVFVEERVNSLMFRFIKRRSFNLRMDCLKSEIKQTEPIGVS